MKHPVSDAAVVEFVDRIRKGIPSGNIFPARMSDCEFTESQRELIRLARADQKASRKNSQPSLLEIPDLKLSAKQRSPAPVAEPKTAAPKAQTKLQKMLYLQSGRCFFCGEPLKAADASVEHLNPRSRGGTNAQDNLVVCHKSLNATFGDMDLKRKFEFVLKSVGSFRCPDK